MIEEIKKKAIRQHSFAVSKIISSHILFCPRVIEATFIRLSDGRQCSVSTVIGKNKDSDEFEITTYTGEWFNSTEQKELINEKQSKD